jgi:hypothetical protein
MSVSCGILPYFSQARSSCANERDEFIDICLPQSICGQVIESLIRTGIDKGIPACRPGDNHHTIAHPSGVASRVRRSSGPSGAPAASFCPHFQASVYICAQERHPLGGQVPHPHVARRHHRVSFATGRQSHGEPQLRPRVCDRIKHRGEEFKVAIADRGPGSTSPLRERCSPLMRWRRRLMGVADVKHVENGFAFRFVDTAVNAPSTRGQKRTAPPDV